MTGPQVTLMMLVTADSLDLDDVMHTRVWELPPTAITHAVARLLSERFGPPEEGLMPVGSFLARADLDRDGEVVFTPREGSDG